PRQLLHGGGRYGMTGTVDTVIPVGAFGTASVWEDLQPKEAERITPWVVEACDVSPSGAPWQSHCTDIGTGCTWLAGPYSCNAQTGRDDRTAPSPGQHARSGASYLGLALGQRVSRRAEALPPTQGYGVRLARPSPLRSSTISKRTLLKAAGPLAFNGAG